MGRGVCKDCNCIEPEVRSYYDAVGYGCFGPLTVGFLEWMAREALDAGCDQLIFAARDCFVFDKAFSILYPDFKLPTSYLYLSRASTLPARIVERPTVETLLNNATLKRLTSPNLLIKRYGFDEKEWSDQIVALGIEPDRPVDRKLYYAEGAYRNLSRLILDAYLPTAYAKTDLLCRYLEQQGVRGKVAVVDSGWNGSTQSSIISLGERLGSGGLTTYGLYLMANKPEKQVRKGMDIKGYIYDSKHPDSDFVFAMAAQGFIEFFCGQPCGSTIGYSKGPDGTVTPVLDTYEFGPDSRCPEVADIMGILHEGCLRYVRDNVGVSVSDVDSAFSSLRAITSSPSYEDVKRIGELCFMEGEVHHLAKPDRLGVYLKNPKKLIADFSHSTWKLGFLNALFRNEAFSLFAYRKLLRFK